MLNHEAVTGTYMDPELALQALVILQNLQPSTEDLNYPIKFLQANEHPKVLAEIVAGLGRPRSDRLADKAITDLVGVEMFEAVLNSDPRRDDPSYLLHLYSYHTWTKKSVSAISFHLGEGYALDLSKAIVGSHRGKIAKLSSDGEMAGDPKVLLEALNYSALQMEYVIDQLYPMPIAPLAEELAV